MTIVYTTIFDGSDSLKPAPAGADRCVCFVDDKQAFPDAKGWNFSRWGADFQAPRREAWHVRCVPHLLFPEAERTVWIDASFTLTDLPRLLADAGDAPIAALRHHTRRNCYQEGREIIEVGQAKRADVRRQLDGYRAEGFAPQHLSISCVLVRDNSPAVRKFNETWDDEIRKHRGDNTQLSLDYAAWKHGLTIAPLQGVRKQNPYAVHNHRDHKRRRRSYDTEAA